jgi:predicted SnoaL-like aldol condensation-catalyzing enzyme
MHHSTPRAAGLAGVVLAAITLAGCSPTTNPINEETPVTTELTPAEIVIPATTAVFGEKDVDAVDTYFGPTYTQHSTLASDGTDGLKALASSLTEDFRYEPARTIADGNLVVTQGTYYGFGPAPLTGFDVWRVEGDKIVEHWDSLTPVVETTVSGRTQTDGPTDTPKNHERRSVPFPAFLGEMLEHQCSGRSLDDLVFPSPTGEVLRSGNFRRRSFTAAAKQLRTAYPALPPITPHSLRHTAASLAISAGATVLSVQRMLGHASAAMTLDVYSDLFDDDLDAVAEALNDRATKTNVGKTWANAPRSTATEAPDVSDVSSDLGI